MMSFISLLFIIYYYGHKSKQNEKAGYIAVKIRFGWTRVG